MFDAVYIIVIIADFIQFSLIFTQDVNKMKLVPFFYDDPIEFPFFDSVCFTGITHIVHVLDQRCASEL